MKLLFAAALFLFVCGSAFASALFHGAYAPDLGVFEPSAGIGELCLNGAWQFMGAEDSSADPGELEPDPTPISIPSPWNVNSFSSGNGGDFRCYPSYPKEWESYKLGVMTKEFTLPSSFEGKEIFICFKGIAGGFEAFMNEEQFGEGFDSFMPFYFDVTKYVKPGVNTLTVRVVPPQDFNKQGPRGNITYPSGSFWGMHIRGIWQDVILYAREKVSIQDVYLDPSVSSGRVTAEVTVANYTDSAKQVDLSGSVYRWITGKNGAPDPADRGRADFGKALAEFSSASVTVPAGGMTTATVTCSGAGLPLWSMDKPSLLLASFTLSGDSGDRLDRRFGYREYEIKGRDLLLNGKKIVLKGDSWHFMGIPQMTRRYPWAWYTAIKAANGNAVRLHAQPYPEFYMDMADEMGIAVLDESAIWESHCAFNFMVDEFWTRARDHVRRLVLRDRNHPSVFGWSIENEVAAGMGVAGHTEEERSMVYEKCGALYDICRELDPSRVWVSGDGCEDLGGQLPVNMLHYGGGDYYKTIAAKSKPWGVGECTAAYYGTPKEVSKWNGDRAYESMLGRMEALAYESWANLALDQRANGATYMCVFNLAWYALQPLPLGLANTAKAPALRDGIFFDRQQEGQLGVQPERLGPYTTTFNPGYDPSLPLYREWPMFEAIKDAFEPAGAKKGKWSAPPEEKVKYRYPAPWIDKVCYAGDKGSKLYSVLRLAGWDLTGGDDARMLLVDGSSLDQSNIDAVQRKADAFTRAGKIVCVWGLDKGNAPLVSRIAGAGVQSVERRATSMVSRYIPNAKLYFTESSNKEIMSSGIGGDILTRGNRVIDPCNTEWDAWNYRGENVKTAAVFRTEQEQKPDAAALVSVPKDKGKVLVCSIDVMAPTKDKILLYSELAAFLGVKNAPLETDDNAAASALGDIQHLKQSPFFDCADFTEANEKDFVGMSDSVDTADWKPASANDKQLFDFDGTKHTDKAVYLSMWMYSPKALDELLADPNVPKITFSGGSDDGLQVFVNGQKVFEDNRIHPCQANQFSTGPLPIRKGWNQIIFKVSQHDGQWQFMGGFNCTDMDYWSTVVCSVDKGE
ncbi:MAG: hypothetical protein IK083_06090 [Abditibacteriota bacterium]|nr:hypothetical protein [Abditibacteriota bacterium]